MIEKSNTEIFTETLYKYCYNIPYIRNIMLPIIASTILSCYLEVKACVISRKVVEDFQGTNMSSTNIILFILFVTLSVLLKQINEIIFSGPVQYLYRVVGVEAFYHYIRLDLAQFNNIGSGEIQMIIERRSRAYGDILELTTLSALPTLVTLFLCFYSIYDNLEINALYVMLLTGIGYVYLTYTFSVLRSNVRRQLNKVQDASFNKLQDFLVNHETVKSYNAEKHALEYFDNTQKPVEWYATKSHRMLYILFYLQKMVFTLQAIMIVGLGSFGYFPVKLSPDQLVFYITISKTLTNSLNEMGLLYNRYLQGFVNAKSGCFEHEEVDERSLVRQLTFTDKIEFRNVDFSYNNKMILQKTSFLIQKGEKVAIIGKNGTGKSTIVKLLMKFYDYKGDILIDGIDIRSISDRVYRPNIAYATQNTFLFADTVVNNVKYGNNKLTDNEILEMSKRMNVHESILQLKDGYSTMVGERGGVLSSGDRQKIMLMRSLLKKAPIILMDEPTSVLDRITEFELIENIMSSYSDHTIVMIVHNLELLPFFDKILFVKDKQVSVITDVNEKLNKDSLCFKNILSV